MRPSQQIQKAMNGNIDKCDDSVRSWFRLFVYRKACQVLRLPFDERKKAIDSWVYPDMLRDEVLRVFEVRGKNE